MAEWRLAGASRSMAMDNVRRGLKAPWPPAEEHVPAAGIATAASAALAGDTSSAAGASDDLQTAMDEMDSAEFLIRSGLGRVSAVGGFALSEDAESVLQRLDDGTIPTRDADNDAVDDDEADDIDDGGDAAARASASSDRGCSCSRDRTSHRCAVSCRRGHFERGSHSTGWRAQADPCSGRRCCCRNVTVQTLRACACAVGA